MTSSRKIRHEFVEFIPAQREEGVLYISIPFATCVHNCFCGCGTKVVTPLSPVGWQLGFDGETVSLSPSVGNWSFACRSHYIIRRDIAVGAGDMTEAEIASGRARDRSARGIHYDGAPRPVAPARPVIEPVPAPKARGFWAWLTGLWIGVEKGPR